MTCQAPWEGEYPGARSTNPIQARPVASGGEKGSERFDSHLPVDQRGQISAAKGRLACRFGRSLPLPACDAAWNGRVAGRGRDDTSLVKLCGGETAIFTFPPVYKEQKADESEEPKSVGHVEEKKLPGSGQIENGQRKGASLPIRPRESPIAPAERCPNAGTARP